MMSLSQLKKELQSHATEERARVSKWFFKTGKGQYGEGDIFIGVTVPDMRTVAKRYFELSLPDTEKLLKSKIHEERLVALLVLVHRYKIGTEKEKKIIYNFYLKNTAHINNWDLVDLSASYIVGDYVKDKNKKILEKLARSKNLWERRIAMIATFAFIYDGEYEWTFRLTQILMNDTHDLIHKACGWMLREVGKRVSEKTLMGFLDVYATTMPRTMLRYAIERLSPGERKYYLNLPRNRS